jgi:hypothetical protein
MQHNDGTRMAAGLFDEFSAVDIRQVIGHQDEIEGMGLEQCEGFASAPCGANIESFTLQVFFQSLERAFIVLDK